MKKIAVLLLALAMALSLAACGNPTRKGQTSVCTICGKSATHSTGTYGYCDKHWKDAINYKG